MHGDTVVTFGDRGEKSGHAILLLLEQGMQRHGAVFAATPTEQDGFRHIQESPSSFDRARMGRGLQRPLQRKLRSISAAEFVFQADTNVTAESRKAEYILVRFVEKIGGARVKRNAAAEIIDAGKIKAGVT